MRLKNKKTRNGEEESEWIMSYADTVTLLLCFFVIFFSESRYGEDSDDQQVADFESKVEEVQVVQRPLQDLNKLKVELEARLNKQNLKDFKIIQNEKDISIRLKEKGFFNLSSFKVLPKGREALSKISKSLQNMGEDFLIHIEGHTDSKPVGSSAFYSSNLGLSSLRASSAAEVLVSLGLNPENMRAVGFGDAIPVLVDRSIASETGEVSYFEDRAKQNRRIEIRLLPQIEISQ